MVEHDDFSLWFSLLQSWPFELIWHCSNTASASIIPCDISGSTPLYCFDLFTILFSMWVPNYTPIFQNWSHICSLMAFGHWWVFLLMKASVLLALLAVLVTCTLQVSFLWMVTPRYSADSTLWSNSPWMLYFPCMTINITRRLLFFNSGYQAKVKSSLK